MIPAILDPMKEAVPSGAAFFVPGRPRGVRGGVRLGGGAGMSGMSGVCRVCRVCRTGIRGVGRAGRGVRDDRDGRERRAVAMRCGDGRCGGTAVTNDPERCGGRADRADVVRSRPGESNDGKRSIRRMEMAPTKVGRRLRGGAWLRRRRDGICGTDGCCDDGDGTARLRVGHRAGIVGTRFQTIGLCSTMPTVVRGGAFCEVRAGVRPACPESELQFELVDFVVEGEPVVGR